MHIVRVLYIPLLLTPQYSNSYTSFFFFWFMFPQDFIMVVANIFLFKDNRYNIKYCFATRIFLILASLLIRLALMMLDKKLAKCLLIGVCIATGLWRHCCPAPLRTLYSLT